MKAKDYRQSAWNSLSGRWGIVIVIFIIFDAITSACAGLSYIGIGAVALLLVSGPLTLGRTKVSLNVAKGENCDILMLFSGFNDFTRSLVLSITNDILIALWSLLFIIPGIIKSYAYSMSYYILLDDPNISPNEARKKSMQMMEGNKWRLFCLDLSFIGWVLLSILTLGILMLWVAPYMDVARSKFYLSLIPEPEIKIDGSDGGDFVDMSQVDFDSQQENFGKDEFDAFDGADGSQKDDFDFSDVDDEFK